MTVSVWLTLVACAVCFAVGHLTGLIRASSKYAAMIDYAAKELAKNSAANRELFAALKSKGIY